MATSRGKEKEMQVACRGEGGSKKEVSPLFTTTSAGGGAVCNEARELNLSLPREGKGRRGMRPEGLTIAKDIYNSRERGGEKS